MLRLLALVVPLAIDTFAVSAALATAGISRADRLRVSVVFPAFEMAMPLVGLLVGHALGGALGSVADYIAIALLAGVGLLMLREKDEDPGRMIDARGLAVLALGIGISIDELAIGFSLGLLRLSLVAAVLLIGGQAVVASQLGLALGARVGAVARERAERVAGVALIGLALLFLGEKLL